MKLKTLLIISLIVCLGLISAACGNTGKSSSSNDSKSSQAAKSTDSKSSDSSTSQASDEASNTTDPYAMLAKMDGVINATLKVESKKPNTTVDYKSRSMTQNGKKVTFTLIPAAKHQKDFQKGSINALIATASDTKSVTLYNYQIDSANVVSLIDPATNKVIYQAPIPTSSAQQNS